MHWPHTSAGERGGVRQSLGDDPITIATPLNTLHRCDSHRSRLTYRRRTPLDLFRLPFVFVHIQSVSHPTGKYLHVNKYVDNRYS